MLELKEKDGQGDRLPRRSWGPCEKVAEGVAVQQWSTATEQSSALGGSEIGYVHVIEYVSTHIEII